MTTSKKNNNLTIAFLNARSVNTGKDELILQMDRYKPDILALNETWETDSVHVKAPSLPEYSYRHRPRGNGRSGGGVGFYIRKGIKATSLRHPDSSMEQMWIKVKISGSEVVIGTLYRPRKSQPPIKEALDILNSSICSCGGNKYVCIMGDLNVPMNEVGDYDTRELNAFLDQHGLKQLIDEPTRIVDSASNILDLAITNLHERCINTSVCHNKQLSDHAMIIVEFDIRKPKPPPKFIYTRRMKGIVMSEFRQDISSMGFDEVLNEDDVNKMAESFTKKIQTLFDKHAPIAKVRVFDKGYPWMTDVIRVMRDLRDNAFNRAVRTGVESHEKYYKSLRNLTTMSLRNEKKAYYTHYVNKNIKNPKLMWKSFKSTKVFDSPCNIEIPIHLNDPDKINENFLNIPGNANHNQIPDWLHKPKNDYNFQFSPVDELSILKIIQSIKTNAAGHDS